MLLQLHIYCQCTTNHTNPHSFNTMHIPHLPRMICPHASTPLPPSSPPASFTDNALQCQTTSLPTTVVLWEASSISDLTAWAGLPFCLVEIVLRPGNIKSGENNSMCACTSNFLCASGAVVGTKRTIRYENLPPKISSGLIPSTF